LVIVSRHSAEALKIANIVDHHRRRQTGAGYARTYTHTQEKRAKARMRANAAGKVRRGELASVNCGRFMLIAPRRYASSKYKTCEHHQQPAGAVTHTHTHKHERDTRASTYKCAMTRHKGETRKALS